MFIMLPEALGVDEPHYVGLVERIVEVVAADLPGRFQIYFAEWQVKELKRRLLLQVF